MSTSDGPGFIVAVDMFTKVMGRTTLTDTVRSQVRGVEACFRVSWWDTPGVAVQFMFASAFVVPAAPSVFVAYSDWIAVRLDPVETPPEPWEKYKSGEMK